MRRLTHTVIQMNFVGSGEGILSSLSDFCVKWSLGPLAKTRLVYPSCSQSDQSAVNQDVCLRADLYKASLNRINRSRLMPSPSEEQPDAGHGGGDPPLPAQNAGGELICTPPPIDKVDPQAPDTVYHSAHSSSPAPPAAAAEEENTLPSPAAPTVTATTDSPFASQHQEPPEAAMDIADASPTLAGKDAATADTKISNMLEDASGSQASLDLVRKGYENGEVSKPQYEAALRSFQAATQESIASSSSAATTSPQPPPASIRRNTEALRSNNITGFDKLMAYSKVIDQGKFAEPHFDRTIVVAGLENSGKSSLINSIACPDGRRLVPVQDGACTNCFILVKMHRCKDLHEPIAAVDLPGSASEAGLSIEKAHDIIKAYMDMEADKVSSNNNIHTITVELKSPLVPTMNIVDTSGLLITHPASFKAINCLLKSTNEPISCLFCIEPPRRGDQRQEPETFALRKLRELFRNEGLPFSRENVVVVMSKIDEMIDYDYQKRTKASKFWYLKEKLANDESNNGPKTMLGYPVVGIMNPDSTVNSSDGLDLYTQEKQFCEANGIADASVGRSKLAGLLDCLQARHIEKWTIGEIENKSQNLCRVSRQLQELGDDPLQPGFADKAKRHFLSEVTSELASMHDDRILAVKNVVEELGTDHNEVTNDLPARIASSIEEIALAKIKAAISNTRGTGGMRLDRFAHLFDPLYTHESKILLEGRAGPFAKACKKAISTSKTGVEFGWGDKATAPDFLEKALANRADVVIIKPVIDMLQDNNTVSSQKLGNIQIEEEEAETRKKLEEEKAALLADIDLLKQLLPKQKCPSADGGENPAGSDEEDDSNDDDDPIDRPPEKGSSDGENKKDGMDKDTSTDSSSSDEDDDSASRGAGGTGGQQEDGGSKRRGRRGGGSTSTATSRPKCNRELASLAPSVISLSSSSESEDFAVSTTRRKRKGRSSSGGGSARHLSKRSKKAKMVTTKPHFAVGMLIKSHFDEGWYEGEIISESAKAGKDWKVIYTDKEVWDYTATDLLDKRKHQIYRAQI